MSPPMAGKTWQAAKLGRDQSKYAWRLWELDWKPARGNYKIIARAKDAAGNLQPMEQQWNPSGYLWNVAAPQRSECREPNRLPPAGAAGLRGRTTCGYQTACLTCHRRRHYPMQRLTPAQWDREVKKMVGWGAEIKPDHKEAILTYLKNNFKP